MSVDQSQDDTVANNNSLLYTATIYAAPTNNMNNSQVLSMSNSQVNDSNSQATMMTDLNPFLSGSIDITQQAPTVKQLLSHPTESEVKDSYKGKFSRMSWKAQLPKREPHNYDKCQPTAHQTTIYNQILAQQQETPATVVPVYNNNTYMSDVTAANNFNGQNVLNLSCNQQMYGNKMLMNLPAQQQPNVNPMVLEQHENSYKSPQSPSFRAYHHSNQQPYKIPSQNAGYRSNSLPINTNIQLPKDILISGGVDCDFAVPKYPNNTSNQSSKSRSSRSRSNSINLRHGQLLSPLQTATSEPALNVNASSALAQLLTNSPVSGLLNQKGQTISSSAMTLSNPVQQHQQPQRANSFTSSSLVQNSILMAVSSINNSKCNNSAPSTSSGIYHTPTLSPESAFQDSGHHEMSSSSMSPERCLSLNKFHPRESQRRAGHIHAEQKRRYNIKNGFDMLHQLIPQLQQNPNAKVKIESF